MRTARWAALSAVAALTAALVAVPPARAAEPDPLPTRRVAGADRITTAAAAARAGWDSAATAVLATAGAFPDALAATALAASRDAPVLLTWTDRLPAATADALVDLRVAEVVVLGGEAAVAPSVADAVSRLPTRPQLVRVAGADRWATAAAAAASSTEDAVGEVLLASGARFPDALTAATLVAAATPVPPVLLTARDALPAATAASLRDLDPAAVTILGGEAVVSKAVTAALGQQTGDVRRVAGGDRFATAGAALEAALARLDDAPRPLIVTTGEDFPDALAAGALAARLGGVSLLAPFGRLPDDLDATLRRHPERFSEVIAVGGGAALSGWVLDEVAAAAGGAARPGFEGSAGPLPSDVREQMSGVSWRQGCPVGLGDLAHLQVRHWGFDGTVHHGEMVVAVTVAEDVLGVLGDLFDARFPIERMRLVDAYGADDDASMAANNTSAFNCRTVAGTDRWSEHAFGAAVDVNPVQNPYVRGQQVSPPAGAAYLDRSDIRPGMAVRPGVLVASFGEVGWGWGGDWESSKDYQHFSASGR